MCMRQLMEVHILVIVPKIKKCSLLYICNMNVDNFIEMYDCFLLTEVCM